MSSSRNTPIAPTTPARTAHIIHESEQSLQIPVWQQALQEAFTDLDELLRYLELDKRKLNVSQHSFEQFSLRVPRQFAKLITKGDPTDPLLLQILPTAQELNTHPDFSKNPVGDLEAQAVPGMLHKYSGRVLIMATGACAIHCRYCFRRHYPYTGGTASPRQRDAILRYLHDHPTIQEVILSGGDPLMLQDDKLAEWITQLAAIPHLRRLRLHTRLPVVLPERITPRLIELLNESPLQTVLVLHINHPLELSEAFTTAIQGLRQGAVTLLNQAVLLKGVNDSVETLTALSEELFTTGILPYYLHLLDRVAGAAHYEVPHNEARALYRQLLNYLPGYLTPKLVQEIPGQGFKSPVSG